MENFTPIPNDYLEKWMSNMKYYSFKTLMAICRKILGYENHRDSLEDYISLSQIQKLTGLTRATVVKATKELENKQLIIIIREGKINKIKLNIDGSCGIPIQNEIVHAEYQTSIPDEPMLVSTVNTQKKDKETIQNKYYTDEIKIYAEYWNGYSFLPHHSNKTLIRHIQKRHIDILKEINSPEEQFYKAFNNYALIIGHPSEYWFTYKFTFWRFLEKIDTFLDSADPLNNYKIKQEQKDTRTAIRPIKIYKAGDPI